MRGERLIFLGVDIGGTKTDVLVSDENGNVISYFKGGPGSFESLGVERAAEEIRRSVEIALEKASVSKKDVDFAFFGVAGFDHEEDREIVKDMLDRVGIEKYDFDNDGRIALRSGTGDDVGIMVSCGTGSVSYASDGKKLNRIGGYSAYFGEKLGSFLIAGMVTAAVVRSKDGREIPSKLVENVESAIDMEIEELRRISRDGFEVLSDYVPKIISALFRSYEEKDALATKIILDIVEEVVRIVSAHRRKLELFPPIKVVLEGTFFKKAPSYFIEMIENALGKEYEILVPKHPPVVGAVLLAMERAGVDFRRAFEKLKEHFS